MHHVELVTDAGATILRAAGELDAFTAPDLASAFDQAGAQGDGLVVDLEAVSFMDSTALGVIVRGIRELGEAERPVRVVLPSGTARRVFEITTVERVLPLSESRADALAELAAER